MQSIHWNSTKGEVFVDLIHEHHNFKRHCICAITRHSDSRVIVGTWQLYLPYAVTQTLSNLAANQLTWQMTTSPGRESSKAVDLGLSTKLDGGNCAQTDTSPAIWAVDLGSLADIYYVEVLNSGKYCVSIQAAGFFFSVTFFTLNRLSVKIYPFSLWYCINRKIVLVPLDTRNIDS